MLAFLGRYLADSDPKGGGGEGGGEEEVEEDSKLEEREKDEDKDEEEKEEKGAYFFWKRRERASLPNVCPAVDFSLRIIFQVLLPRLKFLPRSLWHTRA